jgi:hypothetical protein
MSALIFVVGIASFVVLGNLPRIFKMAKTA